MTDSKTPVQANGGGEHSKQEDATGRQGAGDSGGGAYPNPHTGKKPKGGFFGHGGQTEIFEKKPGGDKKP